MGLRINNNIEALNAHRNLQATSNTLSKSMEKLSSGLRINRASDDAAGLAISEKLRGQVKGLNQAVRNAQDGISMIQTAEGALNETHSILQRMRELAVQGANDTLTSSDRTAIKSEMDELSSEVTRIANSTQFNTKNLLDGTMTNASLQIGANAGQIMTVSISSATATSLSVNALAVDSASSASSSIASIDSALGSISNIRASLGAVQNRLEHTVSNLGVAAENLQSSESRIRDVDMAEEMMNYTKAQILQSAGTSMLAQANSSPQTVLQLLK